MIGMGPGLTRYGVDQISRVHWDGRTLTVIQQCPGPALAEDWTATDAAGHWHAYGTDGNPYPTLTRVSDGWAEPDENPDCFDEIEHYHLACAQCGETMWPQPAGPLAELLSGVFAYWIDDERVSQRDARAFTDLIREGDPERWDRLHYWLKYTSGLAPRKKRASRG